MLICARITHFLFVQNGKFRLLPLLGIADSEVVEVANSFRGKMLSVAWNIADEKRVG